VVCNRYIKFDALLTIAREMGADRLATGHYARVRTTQGKYQLLKGLDAAKDQSYVLYTLGQNRLPYLIFPLGTHTKTEVRAMAEQRSLPTANRPESQDVCWVKGGDYRDFLAEQRPETSNPGPILDVQGRVLGQHRGIAFYTVGQRHGLGVAAPQPLYVTRISAESNALFVGPKEAVLSSELLAEDVLFVSGEPPACPVQITAKIRYKARESSATLVPLAGRTAQVIFSEPQPAITPGQAVVFYQDDVVLGGGVIS
jgi:tRNA-specific 2-thiouridylase